MKVSVILPVYNRAATLRRCVDSVLAQTFSDWELVAVDDASSDNSVMVLEAYADPRIRIVRHERNKGPSGARNSGINEARGEYIALLDSDDEWLPGKLAAQLPLLERGECDLCGCEYWTMADGGEKRVRLPEPDSWADYLQTSCELGNGTTLVVRRNVLDSVGLLEEQLRFYEDWDWVLRMVEGHRFAVVHEPLARVDASPGRPAEPVAAASEIFLRKHAQRFRRKGERHFQGIRGKHYENVAANAFAQRQFSLGAHYLLKSFSANPRQNPLRLAALLLAPVDAYCGTSLIQRAAAMQRALVSHS